MRKPTCSVIAGNPPADASQPFGKNGMIVNVAINEKQEPSAPRIPAFLFQKPQNRSAPNSHSETPKNQVAPRTLNTEYIQKIRGPWLIYGYRPCASYRNHFR